MEEEGLPKWVNSTYNRALLHVEVKMGSAYPHKANQTWDDTVSLGLMETFPLGPLNSLGSPRPSLTDWLSLFA